MGQIKEKTRSQEKKKEAVRRRTTQKSRWKREIDQSAFIPDDYEVPSTSLAIAGASRLKIEVSTKKSDDDSIESSSENEETIDDPVWTVVDRNVPKISLL